MPSPISAPKQWPQLCTPIHHNLQNRAGQRQYWLARCKEESSGQTNVYGIEDVWTDAYSALSG